jgi:hypothetical protein
MTFDHEYRYLNAPLGSSSHHCLTPPVMTASFLGFGGRKGPIGLAALRVVGAEKAV